MSTVEFRYLQMKNWGGFTCYPQVFDANTGYKYFDGRDQDYNKMNGGDHTTIDFAASNKGDVKEVLVKIGINVVAGDDKTCGFVAKLNKQSNVTLFYIAAGTTGSTCVGYCGTGQPW